MNSLVSLFEQIRSLEDYLNCTLQHNTMANYKDCIEAESLPDGLAQMEPTWTSPLPGYKLQPVPLGEWIGPLVLTIVFVLGGIVLVYCCANHLSSIEIDCPCFVSDENNGRRKYPKTEIPEKLYHRPRLISTVRKKPEFFGFRLYAKGLNEDGEGNEGDGVFNGNSMIRDDEPTENSWLLSEVHAV